MGQTEKKEDERNRGKRVKLKTIHEPYGNMREMRCARMFHVYHRHRHYHSLRIKNCRAKETKRAAKKKFMNKSID